MQAHTTLKKVATSTAASYMHCRHLSRFFLVTYFRQVLFQAETYWSYQYRFLSLPFSISVTHTGYTGSHQVSRHFLGGKLFTLNRCLPCYIQPLFFWLLGVFYHSGLYGLSLFMLFSVSATALFFLGKSRIPPFQSATN
jgi:hypothetical protein